MRKLYTLLLISMVFVYSGQAQFAGGNGTALSPYQVTTAQDLNNVRNYLNTTELVYFEQTANIDLGSYTNWIPIGGGGTEDIFNGVYDGKGHKISNLTINRSGTDDVGLFGRLGPADIDKTDGPEILNLGLINVNITGKVSVGALVGRVIGNEETIIDNCYVIGGIVVGDSRTGGLVGSNNSYVVSPGFTGRKPVIRYSFAFVDIAFSGNGSNNEKFGGLAGCNDKGVIENSYSHSGVTVNGTVSKVGGLTGCNDALGEIRNSYSVGSVTTTGSVTLVGGLLGTQGTSAYPGTVTASYWDTETSGQSTSDGGEGRTTTQMYTQSNYSGWNFNSIWSIIDGETYPYLQTIDLNSGFVVELAVPGTKTAGESFSLNISDATNVSGVRLSGLYRVVITTDIEAEKGVPNGEVLNNVFEFTDGDALVDGLLLERAVTHTLTVSIETIAIQETLLVVVDPAPAVKLVIDQQPQPLYTGNFDDQPLSLGNIVVIATDAFDNPSAVGLTSGQMVIVTIENDGSPLLNAQLGGTTEITIETGTASFTDLTLDKDGTGYTLRFSSLSPENLNFVITDSFDIQSIEDLSGFDASAGPVQYQLVPFQVEITGATNTSGANLDGNVNVQVSSSLEGLIFNQNISFTAGNANFTLALEDLGAHDLTIVVQGVTDNKIIQVTVEPDQSGFTLDPIVGNRIAGIPFDLTIRGATGWNGGLITSARVMVTSNISGDGEVFNQIVNAFDINGDVTIPITLMTFTDPGSHILTVTIETITLPQTVSVVVEENDSGFLISGPLVDVDAGDPFDLSITAASNDFGVLAGNYNVQVTSDKEGLVFNNTVSFVNGVADFPVILDLADAHILTVSVATIIPTRDVNITVVPNVAFALEIVSQDLGRTGTYAGTPLVIGTVTLQSVDKVGNPSVRGLSGTQNVVASKFVDGSAEGNATLGGTLTRDILPTGIVTFDNLTLNKDGVGYVVRFTSSSPVDLGTVDTDPFAMVAVEDQRSFKVANPGPQVVGVNFEVTLYDAKNSDGSLRNGDFNVSILEIDEPSILFSGSVNFVDGYANISTTDPYPYSGEMITRFRIQNHSPSQILLNIFVVENDLSGFAITDPGSQEAGTPFGLQLTNAKDKSGADLDGRNHMVTLMSSNTAEGDNGLLFRDSLLFTNGIATIPDVILSEIGTRDLTVSIDWITNSVTLPNLVVNEGPAATFEIATQPVGGTGNFDDLPVSVGNVVLHFKDIVGNLSSQGLVAPLTVTATIETGPIGATLSGNITADIVNGEVVFNDLTLDRNGVYTLRFAFNGTPVFTDLISEEFTMTDVEDLSGFLVEHPGKQYENIAFDLVISEATDRFGALLEGDINVTVTSDLDLEVFNGLISFTAGNAVVNFELTTVNNHNLTVTIVGVTDPVVVEEVEVALDQSGFSLALEPGPYYQFIPFELIISNATDLDGVGLDGIFNVVVISDQDGTVFSGDLLFALGEASTGIALDAIGDHLLTVTVEGVTNPETIQVLNVLVNQSGFDVALAVPGDKVAGEDFDLNITNAKDVLGAELVGTGHRVVVTSDASGEIFNSNVVDFGTNGAANITVNLTLAQLHTLLVSIEGITPTHNVPVTVIPAAVSKMMITTQPVGGSGNLDDQPVLIGNVIVQTFDEFDNPSISGLGGDQTVSIAIETDPSGLTAQLGGTIEDVDISTGTALFDDLTIDKEGIGFILVVTYNGSPVLTPVITEPFDVTDIYITYTIALDVIDPYDFGSETAGYDPIEPLVVTISRTGSGNITNLNATLGGVNPADFTLDISNLVGVTLDELNPEVTFTVVPNHGLAPGNYSALVTVTADNGVEESFEVTFTVLDSYLITLTIDNLEIGVLDFGTGVAGEYELDPEFVPETVTITKVGTGNIENLAVNLSGDDATSFSITQPVLTILDDVNVSTTFTVIPNTGLTAGTYQATVTVTADNGVSEAFEVIFTVIAPYAISLEPEGDIDFGIRASGYNPVNPVEITITNIGANPIENLLITLGGTNAGAFTVTQPIPDLLSQTNDITTFTVNPNEGLGVGIYEAIVTVSADNLTDVTFNVTFQVLDLFTWVGSTSDWHLATNWDPQQVPGNDVYITIPASPSGGNNPVISNTNATIYNLTLEVGASLTVATSRRLTVADQGLLTVENNAQITAPGDLRILSGGQMVLRPGARVTSTGTLINNVGVDGLVLESSSSSLTASLIHNSSGVQATVQRWMSGQVFHVISSPVMGDRIEDFEERNPISRNTSLGVFAMQVYNEVGGWSSFFPIGTTGELQQGQAYSIRIGPSGGAVVSFQGTLRDNALGKAVTRNLYGWNGVGNPFTSSAGITLAAVNGFLNDNLSQLDPDYVGAWVYDASIPGYKIINNTPQEGSYAQDHVALAQGFIIKAKSGGGNITFNTNLRKHEQVQFFKSAPAPWYNIRLAARVRNNDDTFRSVNTYVAFNSAMTTGLDVSYDAGMYDPDPALMIYTRMPDGSSNLNLGVQALPDDFENMVIPVGFTYPKGGEVVFSAQSLNLPHYTEATLEDRLLETFTDLAVDNYTVQLAPESESLGRFFLHIEEEVKYFPVSFGIEGTTGGIVKARIDQEEQEDIPSGTEVRRGKTVIFTAEPFSGFRLKQWYVNGEPVTSESVNELVFSNLQDALDVKALFEDLTIGIEDYALEGFRIFAHDNRVYIEGPITDNMRAILYDLSGRQVINETLYDAPSHSFSVYGLMRGIYILKLTGGEFPQSVKLLIY